MQQTEVTTGQTGTGAAAEAVVSPGALTITVPGADGRAITLPVPSSQTEVANLRARRDEVSSQLSNVANRRQQLLSELNAAPAGQARAGLEQRMAVLDARMVQLEQDLATTGLQLAATPAEYTTQYESVSGNDLEDAFFEGAAASFFSIAGVVAVVWLWRRWRRKKKGVMPGGETQRNVSDGRLERLEQGMEAIAIEIERVSEGQRFVTRLLSEARHPIGGQARLNEPVNVGASKQGSE